MYIHIHILIYIKTVRQLMYTVDGTSSMSPLTKSVSELNTMLLVFQLNY